jgi:hypothetical protein
LTPASFIFLPRLIFRLQRITEKAKKFNFEAFSVIHRVKINIFDHKQVIGNNWPYSRDRIEHGEDITGAGRVLAALQSGTELTVGQQQIDIVGANVVLGQVDDGGHEGRLAVVVRRVLSHRTGQLRHFHLPFVVSLQASEQHLPIKH